MTHQLIKINWDKDLLHAFDMLQDAHQARVEPKTHHNISNVSYGHFLTKLMCHTVDNQMKNYHTVTINILSKLSQLTRRVVFQMPLNKCRMLWAMSFAFSGKKPQTVTWPVTALPGKFEFVPITVMGPSFINHNCSALRLEWHPKKLAKSVTMKGYLLNRCKCVTKLVVLFWAQCSLAYCDTVTGKPSTVCMHYNCGLLGSNWDPRSREFVAHDRVATKFSNSYSLNWPRWDKRSTSNSDNENFQTIWDRRMCEDLSAHKVLKTW